MDSRQSGSPGLIESSSAQRAKSRTGQLALSAPRAKAPGFSMSQTGMTIAFDEGTLDQLADRLAARLAGYLAAPPQSDQWLDAKAAAEYLGMTVAALHKHTASNAIPFSQSGPNAKLYFQRSQLDAWRLRRSQGSSS